MKAFQFAALLLTALTLIASGAHLFALSNKMQMAQDQYFVAQSIYRGWNLLGGVLIAALAANLAMAYAAREQTAAAAFAVLAAVLIAATLMVFFIWTFPANQATQNWTVPVQNWEALRAQWEYSHAANAAVTFAAFCCTAVSVLVTQR